MFRFILQGSAEIVYMRRSDAFQAMKKYHNVLLDGRPMRLEILGGITEAAPVAARVNVTGLNGKMKRSVFLGYVCLSLGLFHLQENSFELLCRTQKDVQISDSCRQGIRGGRVGRGRGSGQSMRRLPM